MVYKKRPSFKYIYNGLSFSITMVVTMYVFYLCGKWLDERFGTGPIFMLIGIVLSIAVSFIKMIAEVKNLDKEALDKKKKDDFDSADK